MRRAGAVCPIPERPLPVYGREDLLLQLPRPLLQVGNADLFQTQRKLEAYAAKNAARVEAETAEPAPAPSAKTTAKEKMPGARRSGAAIMGRLIGLVKPLLPVMLLAIFLGVVGYLCAISLTILASHGVVLVMTERTTKTLTTILIVVAVARGLLHYGEQYCNHFIAFKLLAIIRHKVFAVLRRLCPAKLEGRDRGDLISILTADIELLEVFYAHTISPIAIAVIVSVIMLIFIGTRSLGAALIALGGYLAVGLIVPLWNGRRSAAAGMSFRERFGEMNSFMLESLRGLDETIQYGHGAKRMGEITGREAKTLHRLLEAMFDPDRGSTGFRRDRQNPLKADVIIVDEASMLDLQLAASLLDAMKPHTRLVLIGDADQLPPMGPGSFFSELMGCPDIPKTRLTEIFRQAQGSRIVLNSHSINRGEMPPIRDNEGDFFFAPARSAESTASSVRALITERIPLKFGIQPEDVQVICPSRQLACGTTSLNVMLQHYLNPPSPERPR